MSTVAPLPRVQNAADYRPGSATMSVQAGSAAMSVQAGSAAMSVQAGSAAMSVQAGSADVQSTRWPVSSLHQRCRDADSKLLSIPSALCQHHGLHCSTNDDTVWGESFLCCCTDCLEIWKSLPESLRSADFILSFKRQLKAHFFKSTL